MSAHSPNHFATPDDVLAYLESSPLPRATSAILLKGGLTNRVYRIFSADGTVIFKYYPPFMAAVQEAPISQERYFVEKEALECVSSINTTVRAPKLIWADDDMKALVMEDAGEKLVSLMDYFRLGNTQRVFSAKDIADKLMDYLQALYSMDTHSVSKLFNNPAIWAVLNQYYVDTFPAHVDSLGVPELVPCKDRLVQLAPPPQEEAVLMMGDLWPNSVLIDDEHKRIWLVDWEVSRFGTPSSDARQMIGNIFLMERKPEVFDVVEVRKFRREFVKRLQGMKRYRKENEAIEFLVLVVAIIGNEFWAFDGDSLKEVLRDAVRVADTIFEDDSL